jgi:uncharacterized membrane protein YraQ (UPF0718 family)
MGRFGGISANILGALLGTKRLFVRVPQYAIHRVFQRRMPIGVTFSFLISSPLVDLAAVIFTCQYIQLEDRHCLCRGRINFGGNCGTIISRAKLVEDVEPFVFSNKMIEIDQAELTTVFEWISPKIKFWTL